MFLFHHYELNEEHIALIADVHPDGQQHALLAQPVHQPIHQPDQHRVQVQQQVQVEEHFWDHSEEDNIELPQHESLLSQPQIESDRDYVERDQECAGTPVEESLAEDTRSALFVRTQSDRSPVMTESDRQSVLLHEHQSMGDSNLNIGSLMQPDRGDLRERRFIQRQTL